MQKLKLGDILVGEGFLTPAQLERALALQAEQKNKRLGEILVEQGYITEQQKLVALSKRLNLHFVDFKDVQVDPAAVALIPKVLCVKYTLVAVALSDETVTLAVNDPLDLYAIEDVKSILNRPCDIVLATVQDIRGAIERSFAEIETKMAANIAGESVAGEAERLVEEIDLDADSSPVVQLINSMLVKGRAAGASDVHIEPFDTQTSIRLRVDGQMIDYLSVSPLLHVPLISRIKILADLDIADRRTPQDGHFCVKISGMELNIRVSLIPTVYGEKAVLRFLSRAVQMDHADTFGMRQDNYEKALAMLKSSHGLIYLTGPTGCGKTTTLYMMMERLAGLPVNICTIEDPVERNIMRINQTQVNNTAGLTFEAGLRALLRQDPDVIMVGETRDSETASTAVRAAITGHLVLSTLHTNDSVSAITRLTDMGVEDYLIANSLVGVIAQRLVKKICPDCKTSYQPSEQEQLLLGSECQTLYKGKGCHNCNGTGYRGRIAVHEVLVLDKDIRRMIARKTPADAIYDYVDQSGKLHYLAEEVRALVYDGVTNIDELIRLSTSIW